MKLIKELSDKTIQVYAAARSIAINHNELQKMKAKFPEKRSSR